MEYMNLVLADGSVIRCLEGSSENELFIKGDIEAISYAISKITNANLKRAVLATIIEINNKVVDRAEFTVPDADGLILLTYMLRDKNETEIINERLDEQDAALMELAEMIAG